MNKLAQLERDSYVRGVIDTIDNLDAPLNVKLASVDLLLTKEAGIAEDVRQQAKDLLARGEAGLRNAVEVGKADVKNLANRGKVKAESAFANLLRRLDVAPSIPAAGAVGFGSAPAISLAQQGSPSTVGLYEELLSRPLSSPAAIEQAALSASPAGPAFSGVKPGMELAAYQGGQGVPVGDAVTTGRTVRPGVGPRRALMVVPEAEAASGLGRFLPKTRLGKAGLGVAGLGALGLGANYLMGEDEPASFSDRLMSGDLSPEEMAALGLGGAALGTGAYYAGKELL